MRDVIPAALTEHVRSADEAVGVVLLFLRARGCDCNVDLRVAAEIRGEDIPTRWEIESGHDDGCTWMRAAAAGSN